MKPANKEGKMSRFWGILAEKFLNFWGLGRGHTRTEDEPAKKNDTTPTEDEPAKKNDTTPTEDEPAKKHGTTPTEDEPAKKHGTTPTEDEPEENVSSQTESKPKENNRTQQKGGPPGHGGRGRTNNGRGGGTKQPRPKLQPRPELVCRNYDRSWNVFLTASAECKIKEVKHDGKTLEVETGGECNISSFGGKLSLVFEDGEQDISLFNEKPLIFKMKGIWTDRGRMISGINKGYFIVIAPKDWERTGTVRVGPEHCKDPNFLAHYFVCNDDTIEEDIGGFKGYEVPLIGSSIKLIGNRVFDDSRLGELFVGTTPNLEKSQGIVWARVGDEEKDGWKGRNFKPTEQQNLKHILGDRQGHFFIRVYGEDGKLLDSDQFRYLQDLEEISVNGRMYTEHTILTPSADGHSPTKVQFNGVDGASLRPILKPEVKHAQVDAGTLTVDPHPGGDDVLLTLESKTGSVDIALRLPRIWWRMEDGTGKHGEWLDKPLTMTRQNFREHADANVTMQLILPQRIKSVCAGFDDDLNSQQTYRPKRDENRASLTIPLINFAYYRQIEQKLERDTTLNITVKCGDSDNIRIPLISVSADVISSPSIINGAQPEGVLKDGITYAIDMDELKRANMSFQYMVYSRLCRSKECTFCKEHGPEYPMPTAAAMIRGLSLGCSKQPAFLRPTMTLGEVVFRLLLKRNNKPASIKDVEAGMIEAWGDLIHLKNTSRENTLGTLAGPNEYFIKRIDK